jgi:hypothetical protein
MGITNTIIIGILCFIAGYMVELLVSNIKESKEKKELKFMVGNFPSKGEFEGWMVEVHNTANPPRYFPKHKESGQYLFFWNTTQKYTLEPNIDGAVWEYNSKDAAKHILAYKHQQTLTNEEIDLDKL